MRARVDVAFHADDDVVREAQHHRLVGRLERCRPWPVLPAGGSAATTFQLRRAHRLLDQLEGLLDRAVDHDDGAQVGIGLLLQLGEALARIGAAGWRPRRAAWPAPRSAAASPDRW